MDLLTYLEKTSFSTKNEPERAKLACFYAYKEKQQTLFSMSEIVEFLVNCGCNKPNLSRLKDNLLKGKSKAFVVSKQERNKLEFIPAILAITNRDYGNLWDNTETIDSSSEIIDENKFCGKRAYLTRLIQQINSSYKNNCFDACAVLMRRLFEVLLVLSFQHHNIEDQIKDQNGNYVMLERIVSIAKNEKTLKLSRNKDHYDTFRQVGNFSAHSITYTAGVKDIDDIKLDYRAMLEELFNKSGLI